jgi:glycosyltransferase involved in cell wall biosynthesis
VSASRPLISVICCAHNEEEYVNRSMPLLLRALEALKGFSYEIVFVADRCTDKTVEKARKYGVRLIEKEWKKWEYSYAESLQTGYLDATGVYVGIVDVDIGIPVDFFRDLVPVLRDRIASVAARVVTYPDTLWNRVMYAWERTRDVAPLGRQPYGAARVILKRALDDVGGFRDVSTPDTDIDLRIAEKGYESISVSAVKVYHLRHLSLRKMIGGQINSGRGRYALDLGLARTIGHSIFRLRPLVICGWLLERQRKTK